MTWAKFSTEFPDDLANLGITDAAYRTHSEAIMWLFRVESGTMRIPKRMVPRFAGSLDSEQAIKELTGLRMWRDRGTEWEVIHSAEVIRQSLAAQKQKRARDRAAQQALRDRKSATPGGPDVSAYVSADVSAESVTPQTTKPTTSGGGMREAGEPGSARLDHDRDPAPAALAANNGSGTVAALPHAQRTGTEA